MGTTDTENTSSTSPEVDDSTLTTPYEKLTQVHDIKFSNDVALEKRVGLYRFCGTIGKGNFSQVKSAIHLLTKGKKNEIYIETKSKSFKKINKTCQEIIHNWIGIEEMLLEVMAFRK